MATLKSINYLVGFFLLGSYDYVNFNNEMNNNNHFGLFGVYPLMLTPGYDMMKL